MSKNKDTALEYYERIKQKAPEYIALLTAITDEEFETAFTTLLGQAVNHLQKNRKNFSKLDEVGLTGVLAAHLTIPGLTVVQEANSNGHVDLTIEADHCTPPRTKLGEAKIYSSPSYHIKGIKQLLGRYTTGNETQGLLISYVKKEDINGITTKLKTALDKQRPERQTEPCADHTLKWSLATKHKHTSGEVLPLSHIGCNLHDA